MHNDFDTGAKMLWTAIDLVPREQRASLGAAVKDLQGIASFKDNLWLEVVETAVRHLAAVERR